ncbi:hypothetical protein C6371_18420 [Bacillus atrophaeus]|uniref:hypothetical protein n=1 Tax=Bacillus atrophaeus TaxID=1452 RepID=UPI000D06377E|nr:hypothetical protein [Bacillus atrophaeus]PSA88913.1 hypothetical protein C6371_18420 [Bacillus atrophaeus]
MYEDIKPNWQLDFEHYEKLLKEREFFTSTELRERFIIIYKKIYLYTTLTNSITALDSRSKIENFFNECKNNLIISYDLSNVNYINASKQILRSAIESFFRLSLAISKYIEYKENKKNGIFSATTSLLNLKRMQDSHKVGALTRYVINYYKDTPVENLYLDLYSLYSDLSGVVHVNKKENFTPHEYLSDYVKFNQAVIESHLVELEMVINNIIQVAYYFSFSLREERVEIKKRDLAEFESTLDDTSYLDLIESSFETELQGEL